MPALDGVTHPWVQASRVRLHVAEAGDPGVPARRFELLEGLGHFPEEEDPEQIARRAGRLRLVGTGAAVPG